MLNLGNGLSILVSINICFDFQVNFFILCLIYMNYMYMKNWYIFIFVGMLIFFSIVFFDYFVEWLVVVCYYLQKYCFLFKELYVNIGILEFVILVIVGLESNWGKSELVIQVNNYFGIKIKVEWVGLIYCKIMVEYEGWLMYYIVQCFCCYFYI